MAAKFSREGLGLDEASRASLLEVADGSVRNGIRKEELVPTKN